ncbi:GNAT family N-acetyltransferase [Magnetospira thiophila]
MPLGQLHETITYLDMSAPTAPRPLPEKPTGWDLSRIERPALAFYRGLQRRIGEPWLWRERLLLSDADLKALLHVPETELRVLRLGDELAGMLELDWRVPGHVEIAFLGLVPERIGQGLGHHMMAEALARAWSDPRTKRVWLHTCSYDHPKALDFYRAWGFTPYLREENDFDDPRLSGLLPLTAAPGVPLARSR